MAMVQVKELIEAGVHFGHRASRWNPKMRPYIYGKRNLIHIVDLRETVRGLLRAFKYLVQIASQGKLILFVGTKRQAKETIEREAQRAGMPYVSERWLGGTLTNFRTIRSRLQRLQELEDLETTGAIHSYSKKMISSLTRERKKIHRNLQGIREMNRIPEAIVVIDPKREHIAVLEAKKMGVTTVALIDTDSDPDTVDLPIPGNDDSIRSIEIIAGKLADAVLEGRASLPPDTGRGDTGPREPGPREPSRPGGDQKRDQKRGRRDRGPRVAAQAVQAAPAAPAAVAAPAAAAAPAAVAAPAE